MQEGGRQVRQLTGHCRGETEPLRVPAPRPIGSESSLSSPPGPLGTPDPFPGGSTSQPGAPAARLHLAAKPGYPSRSKQGTRLKQGTRCLEGLGRPAPPGGPSAWLRPRQRRDFPPRSLPAGSAGPARPKGLGWAGRPGSPFPGWCRARAPPRTPAEGPGAHRGGPGAAPGDGAWAAANS